MEFLLECVPSHLGHAPFYRYQSILSFLDQVRWASPPCCAPDREQSGKVPLPESGTPNALRLLADKSTVVARVKKGGATSPTGLACAVAARRRTMAARRCSSAASYPAAAGAPVRRCAKPPGLKLAAARRRAITRLGGRWQGAGNAWDGRGGWARSHRAVDRGRPPTPFRIAADGPGRPLVESSAPR